MIRMMNTGMIDAARRRGRHSTASMAALTLVMASAVALGATGTAVAQGAIVNGVALAVEAEIGGLLNPDGAVVQGERIVWPERIHEFYARRAFQPAWTNAHTAQELRRALMDSYQDGLDPEDYHASLLNSLAIRLTTPAATEVLRAQYDILLTDALLRLGYHLAFGKVDAQSFDAQWNYGRTLAAMDVSQEIQKAIAADNVYQRVEALKPTHYMYTRLKRELERLRQLEAAGGWAPVPAGAALKPDMSDPRVAAVRARLIQTGDLPAAQAGDSPVYDPALVNAVKLFQQRMGLAADGVAGAATLAELNVPVARRILQLRVNLDRGRVLLQDLPNEFVVVNIAGYAIYLVRGQEVVWESRVQVGRTYRRTPIFRSEISYLVWNPTWTVPPGIIQNDILPAARRDPAAITRKGLKVLDGAGRQIDPARVDWSKYRSGYIPYTLRQDGGPDNALGRVKFMFPNPYMVYLHDTPSRRLFDSADRTFSSGCVRVERPFELAQLLLADPAQWNQAAIDRVLATQQTQNVTLKTRMPLLLAYWTAWVDSTGLRLRRDVYGQDAKWAAGLNAPFKVRARPLFASPAGQKAGGPAEGGSARGSGATGT